ncbi:MAG: hypothetical protein PHE02_00015 [Lachnospiraceae bacterium]|nr:hypothetical protein [Lachnospiraceae bacterium]
MMKEKWFENKQNKFHYLFLLMIFFFSLFMSFISGNAITYALQYFFFQVFFLLLPGTALVLCAKFKLKNRLELFALGYLTGYVLNIFSYYMVAPFGCILLLKYLLFLEAIVAGYVCFRYRDIISNYPEDYKANILCTLVMGVMIGIKIITYYGVNRIPYKAGTQNFITADILYYIGNAIELTKEYPPKDFRVFGQKFYYYYWGSMQLAVIKSFVNMAVHEIEFCFAFMQGPILLVLSAYMLLQRTIKNFIIRCYGLISLLLLTGYEMLMSCTYLSHIYLSSFGFDIGLAFLMLTLYFIISCYEGKGISWKYLFFSLAALSVTTGSKAPVAVILMISLGLFSAYQLFIRKEWKSIPAGILMLGTFLLVYFTVVSHGMNTIQSDKGLTIGFLEIMRVSKAWNYLQPFWGKGILSCILLPFIVFILFVISNPNVYICMGMGIAGSIKYKIKNNALQGIFLMTGLFSIFFFLFTHQEGKSEAYFLMCSYLFLIMYGLLGIDKWIGRFSKKKRFLKRVWMLQAILIIVGIMVLFIQYYSYFRDGVKRIIGRLDTVYEEEQYNLISYEEYNAYEWIRNNTDEDALILSNVMLQERQGRNFITGVFTERHLWLEGWEYGFGDKDIDMIEDKKAVIHSVMDGDVAAIDEISQAGVSYVIRIKRITPENELSGGRLEKVFENDEVDIYYIKSNDNAEGNQKDE